MILPIVCMVVKMDGVDSIGIFLGGVQLEMEENMWNLGCKALMETR